MHDANHVERVVLDYLRGVNEAAIVRMPDPRALKLRRVLDSLDMAEFIAFLERTFSFRITDQEILSRNFDTVGSVIEFATKKVGAG